MNTINTLTVNGQSYALPDPRSVLDDSAASPDSTWSSQKLAAMDASASIVCQAGGKAIAVSDASDRAPVGLTVYGKTTQNGTPTPESPIALESPGASGSIGVTVAGKNLLAKPFLIGVHTGTGYYTTNTGVISTDGFYLKAGTYVISGTFPSVSLTLFINGMANTTTTSGYQKYYAGKVFEVPEDGLYNIQFNRVDGKFTDAEIQALNSSAQVEFGDTATVYEPYKGQSLTLSTPNGLPGIPLDSGGNYTDETGQAWICDEIDLARGVYVRRLSVIESYAGEAVSGAYMSTTGELSQGASVLYALEGPAETALTAAELAAYAALHTVKPNTTVYNDASAHMELRYVADTKAYIDRKLAALAREVTA